MTRLGGVGNSNHSYTTDSLVSWEPPTEPKIRIESDLQYVVISVKNILVHWTSVSMPRSVRNGVRAEENDEIHNNVVNCDQHIHKELPGYPIIYKWIDTCQRRFDATGRCLNGYCSGAWIKTRPSCRALTSSLRTCLICRFVYPQRDPVLFRGDQHGCRDNKRCLRQCSLRKFGPACGPLFRLKCAGPEHFRV